MIKSILSEHLNSPCMIVFNALECTLSGYGKIRTGSDEPNGVIDSLSYSPIYLYRPIYLKYVIEVYGAPSAIDVWGPYDDNPSIEITLLYDDLRTAVFLETIGWKDGEYRIFENTKVAWLWFFGEVPYRDFIATLDLESWEGYIAYR